LLFESADFLRSNTWEPANSFASFPSTNFAPRPKRSSAEVPANSATAVGVCAVVDLLGETREPPFVAVVDA